MGKSWLGAHADLLAFAVIVVGLVARLWAASGTFLNPDEALHFRLANQLSLAQAYKESLTASHPPLLTFVLYYWRAMGTSDLWLRLPSVIAGVVFCWIFYKWLRNVAGKLTGFVGLLFRSAASASGFALSRNPAIRAAPGILRQRAVFHGGCVWEEILGPDGGIFRMPLSGHDLSLLSFSVCGGAGCLRDAQDLRRAAANWAGQRLGSGAIDRARPRRIPIQVAPVEAWGWGIYEPCCKAG